MPRREAPLAIALAIGLIVGIAIGRFTDRTLVEQRPPVMQAVGARLTTKEAVALTTGLTRSGDGLTFGEYVKARLAAEANCTEIAPFHMFNFVGSEPVGDDPYKIGLIFADDPPPGCSRTLSKLTLIAHVHPVSRTVLPPSGEAGLIAKTWLQSFRGEAAVPQE